MKKRLVLAVLAAFFLAVLSSCGAAPSDSKNDNQIAKVLNEYGYQSVSQEEEGEDEASFGFFSSLSGDEETKNDKKNIRKMQDLIEEQIMYTNEELDDRTGFVNLVFEVRTKSEEDAKTLMDYYDGQYRGMEGCRVKQAGETTEYINYEDVYYLKVSGSTLIKGQCNAKVIKETEEMLEKL